MNDKPRACCRLCFGTALAIFVLIGAATWFGWYDVAADVPHWTVTKAFLEAVRERSKTAHAAGIAVPKDLDSSARISAGAGLYDERCTACHLAPGKADSELREGLYPKPPIFAMEGEDDPPVAFWTIKHGVKMTAMPAWGKSHTDDQIWDLVAFLLKLKGMSTERYHALVASAPPEDQWKQTGNSDVRVIDRY